MVVIVVVSVVGVAMGGWECRWVFVGVDVVMDLHVRSNMYYQICNFLGRGTSICI